MFIILSSHFLRVMRSIAANYVPNFPFPSELVAGTLFHLIAMASRGEQMASNNDVCEKGTQLVRKHLFASGSSS